MVRLAGNASGDLQKVVRKKFEGGGWKGSRCRTARRAGLGPKAVRKGFGNSFQDDIARGAGQLICATVPVGDAPLVVNEVDTVEEIVTKLLLQGGQPHPGSGRQGCQKGATDCSDKSFGQDDRPIERSVFPKGDSGGVARG